MPADQGEKWDLFAWLDEHGVSIDWGHWERLGMTVTHPRWYGLWVVDPLPADVLEILVSWAWKVRQTVQSVPNLLLDITMFERACRTAREQSIPLRVESFPPGKSDGVHWFIPAYCQWCRAPRIGRSTICPTCRRDAPIIGPQKRRVLGRRPYLNLETILGAGAARAAYARYRRNN